MWQRPVIAAFVTWWSWYLSPGWALAQDVSFHRQVLPLLTRTGCNAGACHGAAAGRGALHLSLFGSDPSHDYYSLVHQFEGRRIHRLEPGKSLLLRKPSGELNHGGDQLFDHESPEYRLLATWIRQGVTKDEPPTLTQLVVQAQPYNAGPQPAYRLVAMANFAGEKELVNVTSLTQFIIEDRDALELNESRDAVRVLRPGQHTVIARYLNQTKAIQLRRSYQLDSAHDGAAAQQHPNSFIDREIDETLRELQLPVGKRISDAAFLRRVTLDLTGRLPQLEETEAFVTSSAVDKRERAVDRLLASPAFVDYWTLVYARWLRLHSLPNESQAAIAYGNWIRSSIVDGTSWSDMTKALLTAEGDSHFVGPANFSRMVGDARAHAELVSELFLGARMGCANCHDHPLDRWTQDDYHGLAAMLARVDRGRMVHFTSRGDVTHPKTSQPARWRLPGDRFVDGDRQPAVVLADWLNDGDQVRLSQAFTNRVWSEMFGRGLVEAIDDMRETNPASHPQLLESLARSVAEQQYDLRSLLRWIASSQAYARESTDRVDKFYGYHASRPLPPHVLVDAIADVTEVPANWEREPSGTRAVQLLDPLSPAPELDVLGRCQRAGACVPSSSVGGLATQLHLINGQLINRTLTDPRGRLARLLESRSTSEIIDEFALRAFSELPEAETRHAWLRMLEPDRDSSVDDRHFQQQRQERMQDWLWSVLGSQRFQRNR